MPPRSFTSWLWPGRMNTRWRKSISRSTPIPRSPRRLPRQRWIRWAGWCISEVGTFLASALACAVSAGLMVVTATVLLVDALRAGVNPESLTLRLYLLFGGTLSGIGLAAWAAWRLLGPIG